MWILIVAALVFIIFKFDLITKFLEWQGKRYKEDAEAIRQKLEQQQREKEAEQKKREQARQIEVTQMSNEELVSRTQATYLYGMEDTLRCTRELAERYCRGTHGTEKDPGKAFPLLRRLSEQGICDLNWYLGKAYQEGIPGVVEANESRAAMVYCQGAKQNALFCKGCFVEMVFENRGEVQHYMNSEKALPWLQEIVSDSSQDTLGYYSMMLSEMYEEGNPLLVREDDPPEQRLHQALRWLKVSADRGDYGAMNLMALACATGEIYDRNDLVDVNPDLVREYAQRLWNDPDLKKARESGETLPCYQFLYAMAVISRGQPEEMMKYLQLGVQCGDELCQDTMKMIQEQQQRQQQG